MTNDQYSKIICAIQTALESDTLPAWRRPWRTLKSEGLPTLPTNAVSGKPYRGINVPILWGRMDADMRYVTYRQAQELGGHVKRGEHGTQIVFWRKTRWTTKDEETGEDETRNGFVMRFYTVFGVTQCEGLRLKDAPKPTDDKPLVMNGMGGIYAACGATVHHGGDRAYYAPGPDIIGMPEPQAFTDADAYAATALHELTHWTGHKARLDRDFSGRFGGKAYAAEELVAEFGSAFLCAALGVNSALEHHASYLQHWKQLLTDEPRALVTATSKAQAACDYLLAKIRPEQQTTAEEDDLSLAA